MIRLEDAGNEKELRLSSDQEEEGGGNAETYGYVSAFTSTGFTATRGTDGAGDDYWNESPDTYVSWSWLAGGSAPTQTYKVVVVSDSGNKYRFRNSTDTATFGTSAVTLDLQEGGTYTFDVSDSTMSSHPFVLGTSSGTDGSYSTGVTYKLDGVTKTYSQYTSGFSSATTRQLIITVAASHQHYITIVQYTLVWVVLSIQTQLTVHLILTVVYNHLCHQIKRQGLV